MGVGIGASVPVASVGAGDTVGGARSSGSSFEFTLVGAAVVDAVVGKEVGA